MDFSTTSTIPHLDLSNFHRIRMRNQNNSCLYMYNEGVLEGGCRLNWLWSSLMYALPCMIWLIGMQIHHCLNGLDQFISQTWWSCKNVWMAGLFKLLGLKVSRGVTGLSSAGYRLTHLHDWLPLGNNFSHQQKLLRFFCDMSRHDMKIKPNQGRWLANDLQLAGLSSQTEYDFRLPFESPDKSSWSCRFVTFQDNMLIICSYDMIYQWPIE